MVRIDNPLINFKSKKETKFAKIKFESKNALASIFLNKKTKTEVTPKIPKQTGNK